jgi:hypothetical protein
MKLLRFNAGAGSRLGALRGDTVAEGDPRGVLLGAGALPRAKARPQLPEGLPSQSFP